MTGPWARPAATAQPWAFLARPRVWVWQTGGENWGGGLLPFLEPRGGQCGSEGVPAPALAPSPPKMAAGSRDLGRKQQGTAGGAARGLWRQPDFLSPEVTAPAGPAETLIPGF